MNFVNHLHPPTLHPSLPPFRHFPLQPLHFTGCFLHQNSHLHHFHHHKNFHLLKVSRLILLSTSCSLSLLHRSWDPNQCLLFLLLSSFHQSKPRPLLHPTRRTVLCARKCHRRHRDALQLSFRVYFVNSKDLLGC